MVSEASQSDSSSLSNPVRTLLGIPQFLPGVPAPQPLVRDALPVFHFAPPLTQPVEPYDITRSPEAPQDAYPPDHVETTLDNFVPFNLLESPASILRQPIPAPDEPIAAPIQSLKESSVSAVPLAQPEKWTPLVSSAEETQPEEASTQTPPPEITFTIPGMSRQKTMFNLTYQEQPLETTAGDDKPSSPSLLQSASDSPAAEESRHLPAAHVATSDSLKADVQPVVSLSQPETATPQAASSLPKITFPTYRPEVIERARAMREQFRTENPDESAQPGTLQPDRAVNPGVMAGHQQVSHTTRNEPATPDFAASLQEMQQRLKTLESAKAEKSPEESRKPQIVEHRTTLRIIDRQVPAATSTIAFWERQSTMLLRKKLLR